MDSLYGRTFTSLELAKEAVDATAKGLGICLVIHSKRPNAHSPVRVVLRCTKGRTFKPAKTETNEAKRRQTATQMTACPYRLNIKRVREDDTWLISPVASEGTNTHNHPLLESGAFSRYRKKALQSHKEEIIGWWNTGTRPVQILAKLRASDNPDLKAVTSNDISNLLITHRREELQGRMPIEWLYDQLRTDSFIFQDFRNEHGQISRLFIAPKTGLNLLRQHPDVILCDSTYKTNRFNMPLFNICGVTSTNKTFQIAAVFLDSEAEPPFSWTLAVLYRILLDMSISLPKVTVTDRDLALLNAFSRHPAFKHIPHILCRWHINMNVLAKTKQYFPKATFDPITRKTRRHPKFTEFLKYWNSLIDSHTVDDFQYRLERFTRPGVYPESAIRYAVNTWITPWKEKFVRCYLNNYLHFGFTTTSVVESLHSALKRWLCTSTGDLTTVFQRLCIFWNNQNSSILSAQLAGRNRALSATMQMSFVLVRDHVTQPALRLILKELGKLGSTKPTSPCHPCSLVSSYGLPCQHKLWEIVQNKEPIQLNDINCHWYWNREASPTTASPIPLDPAIIQPKGRPKGAIAADRSSRKTTRNPSMFEHVHAIENAEARESRTLASIMSSAIQESSSFTPVMTMNTTIAGLHFVSSNDTYEAGTQMQRSSQRVFQHLEDTYIAPETNAFEQSIAVGGRNEENVAVEAADSFEFQDLVGEVDFEGEIDRQAAQLEDRSELEWMDGLPL